MGFDQKRRYIEPYRASGTVPLFSELWKLTIWKGPASFPENAFSCRRQKSVQINFQRTYFFTGIIQKVKKINKVASREKSTGKINKKVDDFALKPSTSFESKMFRRSICYFRKRSFSNRSGFLSSGKEDFGLAKVLEFETIGHYSDWLKVSPRILRRMNGFFQGREMRVGEKFKIPFRRVSIRDFTEKRKEFHGGSGQVIIEIIS